ncbi:MAG: hypothetical protein U1F67_06610 [Rubrivivax sp.]
MRWTAATRLVEGTRTAAAGTSPAMRNHYFVPKLHVAAAAGAALANPALLPNPPRAVPDARSFFLSLAYTMAPLPAVPMKPRRSTNAWATSPNRSSTTTTKTAATTGTHFVNRAPGEEGCGRAPRVRPQGADPRRDGPQHPRGSGGPRC